ncbi:acyltransferase family protein [Plantactinospora solaniradicis]|uniref:Acyltransferase family protein n=1 Tax=Plantactinospora solaniradicis TaxID=1723736 RepID=A0ABW1KCX4_9ACTN
MAVVHAGAPAAAGTPPSPGDRQCSGAGRVVGLDGIRGLAALYVVVHHCWLLTFPGYPANTGPGWLGWLVYGRLAVVAFIVLSGFSLAISPARDAWRLGGTLRFARRRAWRILPPYWAALAVSLVIASVVPSLPLSAPPTLRSVVVYGLLMQDVVAAPAPNGAFWSIAVEVGLYLVFPVLVLIRRRAGAVATLAAVTVPVVVIGLLCRDLSTTARATGYTLELAPLFTAGVLAAGVVAAPERIRRLPWHRLAALAAVPVLLLVVVQGSVWTVRHYYWVDLAAGPAIALFLAAVATRRPAGLVRLLDSRPLRAIGGFSFSLYLIHLPIVALISRRVVAPHLGSGLPAFWATLVVAVPICLMAARGFAALVETPFQRRRPGEPRTTAGRRGPEEKTG